MHCKSHSLSLAVLFIEKYPEPVPYTVYHARHDWKRETKFLRTHFSLLEWTDVNATAELALSPTFLFEWQTLLSLHDAAWTIAIAGVLRTALEHFAHPVTLPTYFALPYCTGPWAATAAAAPHSKQNSALVLRERLHAKFMRPCHLPMFAHFCCQLKWMSACQALNQYLFSAFLLCSLFS